MSFKIKNRHTLKTKEIRLLLDNIKNSFNEIFFDENSSVEAGDIEGIKIIVVNNEPCFFMHDDKIFFTFFGINKFKPQKKFVVVDMGAIRFITNGADIMSPGIVDADKNITEGDSVWISDEKNHKPLAVGLALISGEQMANKTSGKAIKNIHYVGDKLWNFNKSL